MALTNTQVGGDHVYGDRHVKRFDVTFDSSYPTGGESLTAADFGFSFISHVTTELAIKTDGTTAVDTAYDHTNAKLMAFQSTTGAPAKLVQVADTTDLSAYTCRVIVHGY